MLAVRQVVEGGMTGVRRFRGRSPDDELSGTEALAQAHLLFVYMRMMTIPCGSPGVLEEYPDGQGRLDRSETSQPGQP